MTDNQRNELIADIVSAYVSNNPVPVSDLPDLIADVAQSLSKLASTSQLEREDPGTPAVPVKKSVQHDHIVCLECGRKFKALRRHLSAYHDMTPDEYRAKWSLPSSYPIVAPGYSDARSRLAKASGLGQHPGRQ